jgi:predicted transposase YbfD/YdcC
LALEDREVAKTAEKSRGRTEIRELETATARGPLDWPGARQFLKLTRTTTRKGVVKTTVTYALTSVDRRRADADDLLCWLRGRWAIENRCFWVRDATFREDECQSRTSAIPLNVSLARNAAITYHRLQGSTNIRAALRQAALQVESLLAKLGIIKK